MTLLLLQTFVLLLASYFLGAFLACLFKRALFGARQPAPVYGPASHWEEPLVPAPVGGPRLEPARVRASPRPIAPRPIDPVQPRIEVLRRPEPRPVPKLINPARFERALMGPDPNEGIPRRAVAELRPTVLRPVTGAYVPGTYGPPPEPEPPAPEPLPEIYEDEPAAESLEAKLARPRDATTSAAAGAVALAKAAATALTSLVSRSRSSQSAADGEISPDESAAVPEASEVGSMPQAPLPAEFTRSEDGDDFQRIRAIDADIERRLKALGVRDFEHIAAWTPADVKRIGHELGMTNRIDREQWVEQAQILAKGGETYYSRNRGASRKGAQGEAGAAPLAQPSALRTEMSSDRTTPEPRGFAAATQGRSVAEMAAAAAAAMAAASASVTRGLKPIEPISPLSKVDPKTSMPAKLSDAIREREAAAAASRDEPEAPDPASEHAGPFDDLKRISGIGVQIEKRLNAIGITRYEEIANWTSADIDRVDQLLEFKGGIERDRWVEQARILASGGQTEFAERVDRGEDTSRDT